MKAKNPQPIPSEVDAKDKLVAYVYEYLIHSGSKRAAQAFLEDIQYGKEVQFTQMEGPGFLANWWCVFWDLYCAAPEKRNPLLEPSSEARAFHEYNMRSVMSPSCNQTSPPQPGPPFMGGPGGGGGGMMGVPRYGSPHPGPIRGGPPVNVGPPPPRMMGQVGPRYVTHMTPPGHMTPGSSSSSIHMGPEPGQSPGINRMTPNHSGSPHPPVVLPNGMSPMPGPPPGAPLGGPPSSGMGPGGPMQSMPPRGGGMPPQSWQGNFAVNSPADQQCFMPGPPVPGGQPGEFGGMMMNDSGMMDSKPPPNSNAGPSSQQQQDEYVMPNAYGQPSDSVEASSDILKLKESLENSTQDNDPAGFGMDHLF